MAPQEIIARIKKQTREEEQLNMEQKEEIKTVDEGTTILKKKITALKE